MAETVASEPTSRICEKCGQTAVSLVHDRQSAYFHEFVEAPAAPPLDAETLKKWAAWEAFSEGRARTHDGQMCATRRDLSRALLAANEDEKRARDAYYEKDAELARCEQALVAAEREIAELRQGKHEEHCKLLVAERIAKEYAEQEKGCRSHAHAPLTWCHECLNEECRDADKQIEAAEARVAALEAALAKVPHLAQEDDGSVVLVHEVHPDAETLCARLGGRCALDALVPAGGKGGNG